MAAFSIEKLSREHQIGSFSCGEEPIDFFLKHWALDNQKKGYGKTWVARSQDSNEVLGFYTLTVTQIRIDEAPKKLVRGMPPHPIPCFLLARFGVDKRFQRKGLGRLLIADAFERCATSGAGARCLLVDAKRASVAQYYKTLGFTSFPDNPLRLFIKISTIEKAIASASEFAKKDHRDT